MHFLAKMQEFQDPLGTKNQKKKGKSEQTKNKYDAKSLFTLPLLLVADVRNQF